MTKIRHRAFAAFLIAFSLLLALLTSCQTSNALRVPGESSIISKNISAEYFAIADAYLDLKKYDKASQYYKLAMKDKSLRLSAYYKLARSYALAKDYSSAEKCYEDLLRLDPENKDLRLSLAYVKGMGGKTDEALSLYMELSQEYPNDSSVLENYINLLLFLGMAEKAEEQYFILEEKFPDNSNLKTLADKIYSEIDNPVSSPEKTESPLPEQVAPADGN